MAIPYLDDLIRDLELIPTEVDPWAAAGFSPRPWRTAIARTSDRVTLTPRPTMALHTATSNADFKVGRLGNITAADVNIDGKRGFTAVSVYANWEETVHRGYADAEAHRILSDLTALMGGRHHRLVVAGDWNILYRYGESGNRYWKARYDTVFDRANALGLHFAGPRYPHGRQADPWPDELPQDSLCVPTFHHARQNPATASRQLDFVFVDAPGRHRHRDGAQ